MPEDTEIQQLIKEVSDLRAAIRALEANLEARNAEIRGMVDAIMRRIST